MITGLHNEVEAVRFEYFVLERTMKSIHDRKNGNQGDETEGNHENRKGRHERPFGDEISFCEEKRELEFHRSYVILRNGIVLLMRSLGRILHSLSCVMVFTAIIHTIDTMFDEVLTD